MSECRYCANDICHNYWCPHEGWHCIAPDEADVCPYESRPMEDEEDEDEG